jgi:aspartate beta-hydroxylase
LDADRYFPNARRFAESWLDIRDEALAVARTVERVPLFHDIMPEQRSISEVDRRDWRIFVLKAYGVEVTPNMARCPALSSLLRAAPEVLSATISFLAPGKHIPVHRGPFRGILRFQMGLAMPTGMDGQLAAVLKIEDSEYRLADGECLLWDDTYPHEVHNDSGQLRIALLLDVWRREMPIDMELLSRLVAVATRLAIRFRAVDFA